MTAPAKKRYCPCGNPLVKKHYQTEAQAEKNKYCCLKCKGHYHRAPPRPEGFGFVAPLDRTTPRFGAGIQDYLDEHPKRSAYQKTAEEKR